MNGDTIRYIRAEGEKMLAALNREMYLNAAGLKPRSDTRAVFDSHGEFEGPGLFQAVRETEAEEGDAAAGKRLLEAFLANSYISARTSAITDRILSFEAGETITAGGRAVPLRAAEAEILQEPGKHRRDEIVSVRSGKSKKLLPLLRQKLALTAEGSEALGFSDYGSLVDGTEDLGTGRLIEQARLFLKDTEYVSGDMLGWFFGKVMELKPGDATVHDMAYLLNSAELKGYFPATDIMSSAGRTAGESGLAARQKIKIDAEKRAGKTAECFCMPLRPPREIAVSIYSAGGVRDYESYFSCRGEALCYAFTEPDDDFEFRFLREGAFVRAFSELFGNLVYEPKWLGKYLGIDAEGDFLRFLYLRRLMSVRIAAGRTIYEAALYKNPEAEESPALFRAVMENASHCKVDESEYLAGPARPPVSARRLKGMLIEPALGSFLRESFDEEWWRMPAAGDALKDIWSKGGRVSARELCRRIGSGEPDTALISRVFERALG